MSSPAKGPPFSILVVDDDEDTGWMLKTLLELEGHQTRCVTEGGAAIEAARAAPPDVVLLDLTLPDKDGFEVARELRKDPGGDGLHLVAVTGHGLPEDMKRTADAGFDHHLVKPVDPKTLGALLSNLSRA